MNGQSHYIMLQVTGYEVRNPKPETRIPQHNLEPETWNY